MSKPYSIYKQNITDQSKLIPDLSDLIVNYLDSSVELNKNQCIDYTEEGARCLDKDVVSDKITGFIDSDNNFINSDDSNIYYSCKNYCKKTNYEAAFNSLFIPPKYAYNNGNLEPILQLNINATIGIKEINYISDLGSEEKGFETLELENKYKDMQKQFKDTLLNWINSEGLIKITVILGFDYNQIDIIANNYLNQENGNYIHYLSSDWVSYSYETSGPDICEHILQYDFSNIKLFNIIDYLDEKSKLPEKLESELNLKLEEMEIRFPQFPRHQYTYNEITRYLYDLIEECFLIIFNYIYAGNNISIKLYYKLSMLLDKEYYKSRDEKNIINFHLLMKLWYKKLFPFSEKLYKIFENDNITIDDIYNLLEIETEEKMKKEIEKEEKEIEKEEKIEEGNKGKVEKKVNQSECINPSDNKCNAMTIGNNQCSRNKKEGSKFCWQHHK